MSSAVTETLGKRWWEHKKKVVRTLPGTIRKGGKIYVDVQKITVVWDDV